MQSSPKKNWPKYTRISLNVQLQTTISQIQQQLPLFSTNDVINFLISKGYQHWLEENPQYAHKSPNLQPLPPHNSIEQDKNIYSLSDGEATQFK